MKKIARYIYHHFKRLKKNWPNRLTEISHTLRMPGLTAYAWYLSLKEIPGIKHNPESDKRILVLSKSAGIDDIIEAFRSEYIDANVMILPRSIVKVVGKRYLKGRVTDEKYISDDENLERDKIQYRKYLVNTLGKFREKHGCDVIIQFSYTYHAERELSAAATELGIRFLTAHKECLNSEPIKQFKIKRIHEGLGKYQGYKISVYNESQKDVIVSSGFAPENRVEIVGCARLNSSHRKRISATEDTRQQPVILYYIIHEKAGLPTVTYNGKFTKGVFGEGGKVVSWEPMAQIVADELVKTAKEFPEIRVILKSKTGFSDLQLRHFLNKDLPDNVEIIREGAGHNLLDGSHVVIGFNSTTVLEALAAGRTTIVPFFKDVLDPNLEPYVIIKGKGIKMAWSREQFSNILKESIRQFEVKKVLCNDEKAILNQYLGNSDQKADQRLHAFIRDALNTSPDEVKLLAVQGS
jgi:hypothetical protein